MISPFSPTGRAFAASVTNGERMGLPEDQAINRSAGLLMLSPELRQMMAQVNYLKQQRPQMPQGTIKDQLSMALMNEARMRQPRMNEPRMDGISALPTPEYSPQFNHGGIVAFAGPEGSLVTDDIMPPRLTPEQINLQQQMQRMAQNRFNTGQMTLSDFPELMEDATPEIKNRVVDEFGNVWERGRDGTWRQARGSGLGSLRNVDSPMRREAEAWRAGAEGRKFGMPLSEKRPLGTQPQGAGGGAGKPPASGIASGAAGEAGGAGAAAAESGGIGSIWRSILRNAGPIAAGYAGLETGKQYGEMRDAERKAGIPSLGVDKKSPWITRRVEEMPEDWMDTPLAQSVGKQPAIGPSPWEIGEAGQAFLSNLPVVGNFIQNPFKTNTQAAEAKTPEAKPAAPAKPAAKPAGEKPAAQKSFMSDLDIMASIEGARAHVMQAKTYENALTEEDNRAKTDKTGPYSSRFTEGDRIKTERMAELKDAKDRSFAKALVSAGLAMAEQASKGGQPGNETQKFMAAAVAGLGGFVKAQDTLDTEYKKAKKEYDELSFNLENLREDAKEKQSGRAWERYKEYQAQAERARDNMIRLKTASAQLDQTAMLTGAKIQSQQNLADKRMQGQLLGKAITQLEKETPYQIKSMELADPKKTPQEKVRIKAEMDKMIQDRARLILSIPSQAAAIQYNAGTGDMDFSAADEIANQAIGAGG